MTIKLNSWPLGNVSVFAISAKMISFSAPAQFLSNLGVHLDESLSMDLQISTLCLSTHIHLRKIPQHRLSQSHPYISYNPSHLKLSKEHFSSLEVDSI